MIALEKGEYIVREVRKHWFFVLTRAVMYGFLVLLPFIIYPLLMISLPSLSTSDSNYLSTFFALYPLWLLLLLVTFFLFWTNYYLDVWVITNYRIMDIEQHGLGNREISEFRLENIQDLTIKVPGVIATFFDFGDVHVQTAGDKREFIIPDASHPEEVKRTIADEHDRVMEKLQHQRRSV